METVNKLLKLLGGMLMGAAVGYFGVMAIIWLVEGSLPSSHGGKEGIDWGMMALSIGVTLVGLFIAVLVHLILHEAGHLIAGQLSRGKRMSEMPEEWTEDRPITEKSSYLELTSRLTYMALLEDKGELDKARQVAEELMALGKKLPQLLQMEVANERVMLELMTINRQEVINVVWTKQVARYTEAGCKYSPIKCAVLYAYELLYNHDAEKAEGYKRQLEVHKNGYTMPGEALTALRLI